MFGLGMQEIIIIGILALLLLGPKKLPELAQTVGKFVRDFQRAADEVKREISTPINDIKSELKVQAGLEPMDQPEPPRGPDHTVEAYGIAANQKTNEGAAKPVETAGSPPDIGPPDPTKHAG